MLTLLLSGEHSQDPQDVSATLRNSSPACPAKAIRLHDHKWTDELPTARLEICDGFLMEINMERAGLRASNLIKDGSDGLSRGHTAVTHFDEDEY